MMVFLTAHLTAGGAHRQYSPGAWRSWSNHFDDTALFPAVISSHALLTQVFGLNQ
jgi:hypothetical protein